MRAAEALARGQEGVKAQFDGIVTRIATMSSSANASAGGGLPEGATVSEGTELFTIESNRQVKVDISVTKYDLPRIAVGQKADITIADRSMRRGDQDQPGRVQQFPGKSRSRRGGSHQESGSGHFPGRGGAGADPYERGEGCDRSAGGDREHGQKRRFLLCGGGRRRRDAKDRDRNFLRHDG